MILLNICCFTCYFMFFDVFMYFMYICMYGCSLSVGNFYDRAAACLGQDSLEREIFNLSEVFPGLTKIKEVK